LQNQKGQGGKTFRWGEKGEVKKSNDIYLGEPPERLEGGGKTVAIPRLGGGKTG